MPVYARQHFGFLAPTGLRIAPPEAPVTGYMFGKVRLGPADCVGACWCLSPFADVGVWVSACAGCVLRRRRVQGEWRGSREWLSPLSTPSLPSFGHHSLCAVSLGPWSTWVCLLWCVFQSANYCFATKDKNTGTGGGAVLTRWRRLWVSGCFFGVLLTGPVAALMILCEVALGTPRDLLQADYYADRLPPGTSSTKVCGRMYPDPENAVTLPDGVKVPMGPNVERTIPGVRFLLPLLGAASCVAPSAVSVLMCHVLVGVRIAVCSRPPCCTTVSCQGSCLQPRVYGLLFNTCCVCARRVHRVQGRANQDALPAEGPLRLHPMK